MEFVHKLVKILDKWMLFFLNSTFFLPFFFLFHVLHLLENMIAVVYQFCLALYTTVQNQLVASGGFCHSSLNSAELTGQAWHSSAPAYSYSCSNLE